MRGFPGLPLAVVEHPFADNSPIEVRRKAEKIVDEIVAILTSSADDLARQYAPRFLRPAERRLTPAAACTEELCVEDPTKGRGDRG